MPINRITQNNFFKSYTHKDEYYINIKRQALNLGQDVKTIIAHGNTDQQALLNKLNDIAIRIQGKINCASLTQSNLNEYKGELNNLLGVRAASQRKNINTFLYVCILLSKHETSSETKFNYFGINKTIHIEKLSETNYKYPDLKSLEPSDIPKLVCNEIIDDMVKDSAAITIQSQFRRYSVQHTNTNRSPKKQLLVDATVKRQIHKHMETISKIFKNGVPSAQNFNGDAHGGEITYNILLKIRQKEEGYGIYEGFGSCEEISRTLFMLIKSDPLIPDQVKNNMHICRLKPPEDHVFIMIGGINDPESYVIDAWLKFVDLYPSIYKNAKYREIYVPATEREVGLLSSKKYYEEFLNFHADGEYVIKGQHIFIKKEFPLVIQEGIKRHLDEYFANLY